MGITIIATLIVKRGRNGEGNRPLICMHLLLLEATRPGPLLACSTSAAHLHRLVPCNCKSSAPHHLPRSIDLLQLTPLPALHPTQPPRYKWQHPQDSVTLSELHCDALRWLLASAKAVATHEQSGSDRSPRHNERSAEACAPPDCVLRSHHGVSTAGPDGGAGHTDADDASNTDADDANPCGTGARGRDDQHHGRAGQGRSVQHVHPSATFDGRGAADRQPAEQFRQRADHLRAHGQRLHVAAVRHAKLAVGPAEERADPVPRAVLVDPHVAVRHRQQPAAHAGRQRLAGAVPAQHHRRGPAGQHLHRGGQRHRRQLALLRRQPRGLPGEQGAAAAGALRLSRAGPRAARAAQEGEDAEVLRRRARRRRRRVPGRDRVACGGEGHGERRRGGGARVGRRVVGALIGATRV
jgi:hypothetical protein